MQPSSRPRTALDSLLSAQRKGLLTDSLELSSEDDILKVNVRNYVTLDDEKSDVSIKLPRRTGDFDKDIPPTPKLRKSVHGLKVKRSKSALTAKATVKVDFNDGNDTDSSDIFVPCSGTVAGNYENIYIMS